jgi:hypothetical protein
MRRICRVLVALGLFSGCSMESSSAAKPTPAPAKKVVEAEPAKTPEDAQPAKVVEPTPEPIPEAAPDGGDAGGLPPQDPSSELAQRFRDPPWYRKTLFPDATVTSTARSEANEQGLFQSHIVFELKQGATMEQCAEHLEKSVGETVANLSREQQPDGRLKISGSTDRYKVTLLCGEAKGTMRAYVAFEWTS